MGTGRGYCGGGGEIGDRGPSGTLPSFPTNTEQILENVDDGAIG